MNKKTLQVFFMAIILTMGAGRAFAAYSMGISTITLTASVTFSGNPVISHFALSQLTQNGYAVISATVTDGTIVSSITSLTVNYFTSTQTDFSTATITAVTPALQVNFSTSIAANLHGNPNYFYYKLSAVDDAGRYGYWPEDGSFYSVGIDTNAGKPVISHIALTGLTADNFAVISATATDGTTVSSITYLSVNYYTSSQTNFSTAAITVGAPALQVYFSTSIAVNLSGAANFYYRITAEDDIGRIGYWPVGGAFYSLNVLAPKLDYTHTPITFVSAITGVVVATGTASGNTPLSSINMYYGTDLDVAYSTYTINIASTVLTYNFDFEFSKNSQHAIDFKGAKNFKYYLKTSNIYGNDFYLPGSNSVFTADIISAKTISLGAGGGNISLPNGNPGDGQTALEIPAGAIDANTALTITELDPADSSVPNGNSPCDSVKPVAVYSFGPEKFEFKKFVTMKLLYQDTNHDGTVDGTNYNANTLKLFWWDGFDWRLYGGKKDTASNVVNYPKIKHFSMYALFPTSALSDNDYRPKERIITPATKDFKNDTATFDGLSDGDVVNLYDVAGRKIRQLRDDFSWDGRDDSGNMVESGIYIYQIKLNDTGKIISGTVVVAK